MVTNEVAMKSKLRDLMTKVFSTPLGFATFAFVVSQVGLLAYKILFKHKNFVENTINEILFSMIGALIAALFVYISYKKIIDQIG